MSTIKTDRIEFPSLGPVQAYIEWDQSTGELIVDSAGPIIARSDVRVETQAPTIERSANDLIRDESGSRIEAQANDLIRNDSGSRIESHADDVSRWDCGGIGLTLMPSEVHAFWPHDGSSADPAPPEHPDKASSNWDTFSYNPNDGTGFGGVGETKLDNGQDNPRAE